MDPKRLLLRAADALHLPVTARYNLFLACAKPQECAPEPRKNAPIQAIDCVKGAVKTVDARAALERELAESKLRVELATTEFHAITSDVPSRIPQPDGTQRIHNAGRALSVARAEMLRAHKRLADFLENGTVPEDIEAAASGRHRG